MNHKTFLLVLLVPFALSMQAFADIQFPIDVHDGQTVETCSGNFVDPSGGDTLNHYPPAAIHSMTFTSADADEPKLVFDFELFSLGQHDTLYVYDGGGPGAPLLTAATGQSLHGETIYASSDSLHFHFVSSDFDPDDPDEVEDRLGWLAAISCVPLCDLFVVTIDPLDGLTQCPVDPEPVSFQAEAHYLADHIDHDPELFEYTWTIEEQTLVGQEISFLFEEPGAYVVNVVAWDPENECEAATYEVHMVATIPHFTGTHISADSACAEELFTLYGIGHAEPWTGFPISVDEDEPVLIGLDDAYLYESTLEFDVFTEGLEVLSAEDFDRICVLIEHVDQSQVTFELESPQGDVVQLKSHGGPAANLGEPVAWEDDIPGTGYEYCFSPTPQFGTMAETSPQFHEYTDNAGNYYFNAAHMPPGNYTPDESLNDFAGSTLNGAWTLRVEDHTIGEGQTGHVFGWSMLFDDQFYPDSLIFIPEITDGQWYHDDSPIDTDIDDQGNYIASTNMDAAGEYDFLFEITDNFGCTYDTTLTIQILPLPEAEIESELEIPICEGDSTLLTVHPLNHDGFEWKYQWQIGGVDMPGRTYDTLMVKEPGLYTVEITDTITGCVAYIDKDVTDQNCDLEIPNVFTPNADGFNDEFEIRNLEHYPGSRMVIYNRWGQKVFEHSDYYNNWWDGDGAPDGTYFYVLQYTRMGKTRYAEGTVTIIR